GPPARLGAPAALTCLPFAWAFAPLPAWVGAHPVGSRILFLEFPPWPWIALVLFGLVPGELFVEQSDRRGRSRYMLGLAAAGVLCLSLPYAFVWLGELP